MSRTVVANSRARLLGVAAAAILGLLVTSVAAVGPEAGTASAAVVPLVTANVSVALPSWWGGSNCDAARWNKLAPSYGWKIDATHLGSHPLGASYLGVSVCGPRPGIDGSPDILWARSGWGESEWECVELAQRFMAQFYGVSAYGADGGYVVAHYRTSYGGGLVTIKNGTVGIAPAPGDIVSFMTPLNPWGHVTVVSASTVDGNGNGTVTMLTQNDTSNGWRTLSVVNWKLQGFNTFVAPAAWLHDPAGRANPLADGAFVKVSGLAPVYRLAGGAPIPVTDWTQFGGVKPATVIAAAQFNRLPTYPTNGTYISDATTKVTYRMAGGAPEAIDPADAAKLPGWGTQPVIPVDHNALLTNQHLRVYPADRTLVCNVSDSKCYQIAGGAPLYLPPTDTAKIPGWNAKAITKISGLEFTNYTHLRATPVDGTFLCDATTKACYQTAGGAPLQVAPADAAKLAHWTAAAPVTSSHWEFANYAHLAAHPVDGTYLCNVTDTNCYVTAGGAPLYVTPAAKAKLPGWNASTVTTTSGAEFASYSHLRRLPVDGTLLEGAQSHLTFQVNSGVATAPTHSTSLLQSPAATATTNNPVVVDQAAIDNAGMKGQWSHLTSVPATAKLTAPSVSFVAAKYALVAWAKPVASSAITSFDVRVKAATPSTGFGAWYYPAVWQNFTATHLWQRALGGANFCFQVRAHNRAGQTGPWSQAACTANALDDRAISSRSANWRYSTVATAYNTTLSRTSTHGAWVRLANVQLDRFGVYATTCATCGSVAVYVNKTKIGTLDLTSPAAHTSVLLTLPRFPMVSGVVTIVATSATGKLVQIDGFALSRT